AAIEAMSLGKVILASRQGGQAELIDHGRNGFLFDHGIPGDFAAKLAEVLALETRSLVAIGAAAAATVRETLNQEIIYQSKQVLLRQVKAIRNSKLFPFTRPLPKPEKLLGHGASEADTGLLSVVVPFYNMGAYIDECINSLLASTYGNLEVLIINDGSTDAASIDTLGKWSANASVKVYHKANEGLAETRNYGAAMAAGKWLAFVDADDRVHPDYYGSAIRVMEAYDNVHFVGSWVQYFGNKTDIWPTWNPEPPYILLHNTMNTSALVYKKQSFTDAGQNDKLVDYGLEDYGSVIGLLANGYRGVVIPRLLFDYRIRPDSMYRSLTRYKAMYSHQYL
ncbi:MAG: glycosyltransferase, partial [Sphingobacteriales bacterium]